MPEDNNIISIVRNSVTLDFPPQEINRGANKGTKYPCPSKPEEAEARLSFYEKLVKFVGLETCGSWVYAKFKQQLQNYSASCTSDSGFDSVSFVSMVQTLAVIRKTIADLEDELDDVSRELQVFASKQNLTPQESLQVLELIKKMKSINADIDDRRRKPAAE